MRGNTIPDLLDSIPGEKAMLVKEIAVRYKWLHNKRRDS